MAGKVSALWISVLLLSGCASLPFSSTDVHKLNSMEMDVLADVTDLVQWCKPVQGFPLTHLDPYFPCPKGNVAAAMMRLAQRIRVERMPGTFACGLSADAVGCWTGDEHLLRYDKNATVYSVKGVLEHEFLHALLYELDDDRHWCSLHAENGVWICYE